MIRKLFIAAAIALLALPAAAQTANKSMYAVKFICGNASGSVPRINDANPLPAPYRAVEPGNYGTIINLQAVALGDFTVVNIAASVHVVGMPAVALPAITLNRLDVAKIDCVDITTRLSQPPGTFVNDGRFVEGYVTLSHNLFDPVTLQLDVTAAYSYAIQNGGNQGGGLGSSLQVVTIAPRNVFQPE